MSNTDKDAIKAAILKLKVERFSFDELRAQVAGDYDSVRDALFELLEEPKPIVRQVFDKRAKAMQLVRVRP
jgi:type I restriction enzyme S subunit